MENGPTMVFSGCLGLFAKVGRQTLAFYLVFTTNPPRNAMQCFCKNPFSPSLSHTVQCANMPF